jgi:hypothetical protein
MSQAHSRGDASLEVPDELTVRRARGARTAAARERDAARRWQRRRRIRWRSVRAVVLIVVGCV